MYKLLLSLILFISTYTLISQPVFYTSIDYHDEAEKFIDSLQNAEVEYILTKEVNSYWNSQEDTTHIPDFVNGITIFWHDSGTTFAKDINRYLLSPTVDIFYEETFNFVRIHFESILKSEFIKRTKRDPEIVEKIERKRIENIKKEIDSLPKIIDDTIMVYEPALTYNDNTAMFSTDGISESITIYYQDTSKSFSYREKLDPEYKYSYYTNTKSILYPLILLVENDMDRFYESIDDKEYIERLKKVEHEDEKRYWKEKVKFYQEVIDYNQERIDELKDKYDF